MTWRANRWFAIGPVVIAGLLAFALPRGVAAHFGWVTGGLTAGALAVVGLGWSWLLFRAYVTVTPESVIVRNAMSSRCIPRTNVLAVEAEREGVCLWFRTPNGPAAVMALATHGLAGYLPTSRSARIAGELRRELGVDGPSSWLRANARLD